MRTLKVCSTKNCIELTRQGRCNKCARRLSKTNAAQRRADGLAIDYGPEWRKISKRFLVSNPVCLCGKPASLVHHIIARKADGPDDDDNLIAMCIGCHNKLHKRRAR